MGSSAVTCWFAVLVFVFSLCVEVKTPTYTTSSWELWGLLCFLSWLFSGLWAGCRSCNGLLLMWFSLCAVCSGDVDGVFRVVVV